MTRLNLKVIEVTPPHRVRFDWNAAQAGFKPVTFTLSMSGRGTRVEVTEGGYTLTAEDAATAVQRTARWAEFLAYLKAKRQFNVELRAGREH